MFHNILLTDLPSKLTMDARNTAKLFFSSVACENADLVSNDLLPVIVSRYATQSEVDFYKAKAVELGCTIEVHPISDDENVFMRFERDIQYEEQKDIRKLSMNDIQMDLNDGVNLLSLFDKSRRAFNNASQIISAYMSGYNKMLRSTVIRRNKDFSKMNIVFFVLSIVVGIVSFAFIKNYVESIFLSLIMSVLSAAITECIFDISLSIYEKRRSKKMLDKIAKKYFNITEQISLINREKNFYFHEVENMVDTMMPRKVLLSLSPSKRTVEHANFVLKNISDGKTLKQIVEYL